MKRNNKKDQRPQIVKKKNKKVNEKPKSKEKPTKVKKGKKTFENKSTSTNGIIDHSIFHLWEGKSHYKTEQGEIPLHIQENSFKIEQMVKRFNNSCKSKASSVYLFLTLPAILAASVYAVNLENFTLFIGSFLIFLISNLLLKNSKKKQVKNFESNLKSFIKNLSQSDSLGKFMIHWRMDYQRRRARKGEMGSLVEEMRLEIEFLKREIRREEALIVPSASKLLDLDGSKEGSDDLGSLEVGNNANNETLKNEDDDEEEEAHENEEDKKNMEKVISMNFDDLSVAEEENSGPEASGELVSVRINGQDLVCFPTRYRIRGPRNPNLTNKNTEIEFDEDEEE